MEAMNTSDQVADNDALSDTYDELHDYDYPNLYYCSALPPAEAIYSDVENEDGSAIKDDSLPTMQTGYDTLDPSTREPTPVPVPYDELTTPEYVNTDIAATEVAGHEEQPSNADVTSDISSSSAPTHSQPESFVTRELPPPPAETD